MTAVASKSELAYEFIKDRIASGRYGPGYRMVISAIAAEVGVSTVPVREAIRRLEAERLVTVQRNVGAQVAMLDEHEYVCTMQTLALVEGYATALAVPFLTAEHVAKARAINARMAQSLNDFNPHGFTQQNAEFHSTLYAACPNPHVLDLVHRGWSRMANLRDSTFNLVPDRARSSVAEHEQLLELIEIDAGAAEVEAAARAHRLRTLDAFVAYQGGRAGSQLPRY